MIFDKKIISCCILLLAVVLTLGFLPQKAQADSGLIMINLDQPRGSRTKAASGVFTERYANQLDSQEMTIYQTVKDSYGIMRYNRAEEIELPIIGTYYADNSADVERLCDDVFNALSAYIYDHPECFWVDREFAVGYSYTEQTKEIKKLRLVQNPKTNSWYIVDFPTINALNEAEKLFNAAVEDMTARVEGMPTYDKINFIYDWIMNHNTYNPYIEAPVVQDSILPWSAYSAVVPQDDDHHYPVCEGYAKAFVTFCRAAGIKDAVLISGDLHMWTAVKMPNGSWYYADPTYDDSGAKPTKDFFLRGKSMHKTHTLDGKIGTGSINFAFPTVSTGDYPLLAGANLGDCNSDGVINTFDAVSVLRLSAGIIKPENRLLVRYDFNTDGAYNTADAVALLKFVAAN